MTSYRVVPTQTKSNTENKVITKYWLRKNYQRKAGIRSISLDAYTIISVNECLVFVSTTMTLSRS
uniref:Uncharacterized protein n=1 Tax=Arundo donax TaxID=35708 RepID=A0A0A9EMD0_ARUDO